MTYKIERRTRTGYDLLTNKRSNKGTAFTLEERRRLGLEGLLPAIPVTQTLQVERSMRNFRRKEHDIDRYIYLMSLQKRNERLFYKVLLEHLEELMPTVYTPTVGEACLEYSHIFRETRGFYITPDDRGNIARILGNWPEKDVRLIVVTDGQRILGLGDLGANGMGIPIGKLALYTACAGIPPQQCMPVILDVGTNNETLLEDPLYLGVRQPRLTGEAYVTLVDEFVAAVSQKYSRVLIQFEDFLSPNAFALLDRYRDQYRCFNDDIQGTAGMALAGVLSACRMTNQILKEMRVLFLGAGSAATGIADLICSALREAGLSEEEARDHLWFVDEHGLLVEQRNDLAPHNQRYARKGLHQDFLATIRHARPQVLIGASGAPGTFTEEVVRLMAEINEQPIIFALSNPTSKAECSALQAYQWSDGRAVFASGSAFPPVNYEGRILQPGQGNNVYIFPGVGLGVLACNASHVTDEMFLDAARTLASCVREEDLQRGSVYPSLSQIRDVSLEIAMAVVKRAHAQGLAQEPMPENLRETIATMMYDPTY
ncbi:MAG: NAD-dependent malic enzyme [Gammaproteobacteria bacterium]|nr:MAG: NAD-dependent malic enzyme [Gammaproteobacteria bacterium]